MKSYMSEMTRTFHRDHSISSFSALSALELTTLPTIMKEVYGEPVTEEEEENEDNFLMKGLKFAGSTAKGIGTGLYDVGEETVLGVYNTVAHPIQTGSAMWDAASHPIDTSKYIINAIEESYERDMVNGDAESRSHWVTYTLGMTATSIFGTKGAGTVTKAGTTTAKNGAAAAKTGVANASKKVSEFDMSNLLPYAPQYQVATGGYVPFNMVDRKQLKDQLIWQAKTSLGNGVKILDNANRLIPGRSGVVAGGNYTKLGKNMMEEMGLKRSMKWTGYQAQHIIPSEMANNPVIQKIGMNLDDSLNGIFLRVPDNDISSMSRHRGYHSVYNEVVTRELNKMDINQSVYSLQKQVYDLQKNLRKLQEKGLPLYPSQGATVELWERKLEKFETKK